VLGYIVTFIKVLQYIIVEFTPYQAPLFFVCVCFVFLFFPVVCFQVLTKHCHVKEQLLPQVQHAQKVSVLPPIYLISLLNAK
jgi:hypothetical protein